MDLVSLFLISIGLAMDAFAVSIASGFKMKVLNPAHALIIALFFGGFQALMPVIGWAAGVRFRVILSGFDHWAAFGLLAAIGVKMIYESFKLDDQEQTDADFNFPVLLTLSLATSIDALAVGLSLSFLRVAIALPAVIIGTVTFLLSFLGVVLGNKVGHFFERKIEIAGGIILIGIGIKILIEHLI
ncbi:MAG: manganese efflux pump MntP family protein [PVC group bacterium]